MTSEAYIEKKVTEWAEDVGFIAIKFTPKGDRGWPDHLFISPTGDHIWIEFKRPGKKPTKLQWHRIHQILDNMGRAEYFDRSDKAISYLKGFL